MRYEPEMEELIRNAGKKAREMGHSYVSSAHLLLVLVGCRGWAGNVLRGFGLKATVAEDEAAVLYGKGSPRLPLPQGLTEELCRILRGAATEARLQNSKRIGVKHILLSLARREDTAAGELLMFSGICTGELFTVAVEQLRWENTETEKRAKGETEMRLLEQFGEDLVLKAGNMEPVVENHEALLEGDTDHTQGGRWYGVENQKED